MSFKLCKECKARFISDRQYFSSTTICGCCFDKREEFLKETVKGLNEAFLFQGGEDISAMNIALILERWIKEREEKR